MKQKLLFFILPVLLFTATVQAQHVWDFSTWADQTELTATTTVDDLTMEPGSGSGFGIIEANSYTFSDSYAATKRFKGGGSSLGSSTTLPTRRYLTFSVSGDTTIKVWARPSGSSTPRALSIMDSGSNELAHYDSDGTTDGVILTANYTGGANTIYIHFIDNAFNLYKIEESPTAGVDKLSPVSTNIKAVTGRIYISDVKTKTEVNIYSINGALIKSLKTTTNTNFSFAKGLWIATVKTNEGQKSVKLVTY